MAWLCLSILISTLLALLSFPLSFGAIEELSKEKWITFKRSQLEAFEELNLITLSSMMGSNADGFRITSDFNINFYYPFYFMKEDKAEEQWEYFYKNYLNYGSQVDHKDKTLLKSPSWLRKHSTELVMKYVTILDKSKSEYEELLWRYTQPINLKEFVKTLYLRAFGSLVVSQKLENRLSYKAILMVIDFPTSYDSIVLIVMGVTFQIKNMRLFKAIHYFYYSIYLSDLMILKIYCEARTHSRQELENVCRYRESLKEEEVEIKRELKYVYINPFSWYKCVNLQNKDTIEDLDFDQILDCIEKYLEPGLSGANFNLIDLSYNNLAIIRGLKANRDSSRRRLMIQGCEIERKINLKSIDEAPYFLLKKEIIPTINDRLNDKNSLHKNFTKDYGISIDINSVFKAVVLTCDLYADKFFSYIKKVENTIDLIYQFINHFLQIQGNVDSIYNLAIIKDNRKENQWFWNYLRQVVMASLKSPAGYYYEPMVSTAVSEELAIIVSEGIPSIELDPEPFDKLIESMPQVDSFLLRLYIYVLQSRFRDLYSQTPYMQFLIPFDNSKEKITFTNANFPWQVYSILKDTKWLNIKHKNKEMSSPLLLREYMLHYTDLDFPPWLRSHQNDKDWFSKFLNIKEVRAKYSIQKAHFLKYFEKNYPHKDKSNEQILRFILEYFISSICTTKALLLAKDEISNIDYSDLDLHHKNIYNHLRYAFYDHRGISENHYPSKEEILNSDLFGIEIREPNWTSVLEYPNDFLKRSKIIPALFFQTFHLTIKNPFDQFKTKIDPESSKGVVNLLRH